MKQIRLKTVVSIFFLFAFISSQGQTCDDCGIGTNTPTSKLQIQGCGTTSLTSSLNVTDNTAASLFFIRDDGRIGLNTTSPTSFFQLRAGAASASSSPLKFIAGTNLTTPEAGAVEFDGTRLYYTTSTPTRINLLGNNWGITGGTTLVGGTAASDNLTLSTTSNATKGKILFGTSAYVESTNELGIGTSTPGAPLDVNGSIRGAYRTGIASYFSTLRVGSLAGQTNYSPGIENYLMTTNNYALIQDSAGITYLNAASGEPLDFRIGNTDMMHLTTTGLGIGNTSPSAALDVTGSAIVTGNATIGTSTGEIEISGEHIISSGTAPTGVVTTENDITAMALSNATDTRGLITTTGTNNGTNTVLTITFNASFRSAPLVVITPSNANAQACTYYVTETDSTFVLYFKGGGDDPSFNYHVIY